MDTRLQKSFELLHSVLGNHGNAAEYLGFSRDYYCAIRNGRVNIPKRTADLIILKAQEVSASDPSVTRESAAVSV